MSTHPYWTPPVDFTTRKQLPPVARTYGFQWKLPWREPTTAGYYFGENPVWGRREQVFSSRPEYFAVDNIIPASGGHPLMNPLTKDMQFSRKHFTVQK